jgi:hypothetical protein
VQPGLGRAADAAFAGILDPLRSARDALALGTASPLSPGEQLALARSRFDEVAGQAAGGDLGAIGRLAGAGQDLLGVGGRFLAPSGAEFSGLFATVTEALDSAIGKVERERDTLLSDVSASFVNAVAAQTQTLVAAIQETTAAVRRGQDQVARELALKRLAGSDR